MKTKIYISPVEQVRLGINIGLWGEIKRSLKNITQDGDEFLTTVKIQGSNIVVYNTSNDLSDTWCVDVNRSLKAN